MMRTTEDKLRQLDSSEKKNRESIETFAENEKSGDRWISTRERMPTIEDADEQKCVLVFHRYRGVDVMSIDNVANYGSYVTHWRKLPAPPKG